MEPLFSPSGMTKLPYMTGRPDLGAAVSKTLSCHFQQDQPFVPTATTLALWHINRLFPRRCKRGVTSCERIFSRDACYLLRPVLPIHTSICRGWESGSSGAGATVHPGSSPKPRPGRYGAGSKTGSSRPGVPARWDSMALEAGGCCGICRFVACAGSYPLFGSGLRWVR